MNCINIKLPDSKSIGARFLVASYFAGSLSKCPVYDDCDDLRVIQRALLKLENRDTGENHEIDIHASGTAFRFVSAVVASTAGADFIVTGTPRLCSRPMSPLIKVLREAGADIKALGENETGPYQISGKRPKGGEFEIRGDVSSQFISALMLVAPTWEEGMRLHFSTPLVSRPYAEMTAKVMEKFGIKVTLREDGVDVLPGRYIAPEGFGVEADWSAAGFFYEAALVSPGKCIQISSLVSPKDSLQGDSATASIFAHLGVSSVFGKNGVIIEKTEDSPESFEYDLTDTPDLTPALAVGCALAGVKFKFSGVRNLRVKECDRLEAISTELGKLGYVIGVGDDTLWWNGETTEPTDHVIETYDDHRIAMAFAIAPLAGKEVKIENPGVVAKSFEKFWEERAFFDDNSKN